VPLAGFHLALQSFHKYCIIFRYIQTFPRVVLLARVCKIFRFRGCEDTNGGWNAWRHIITLEQNSSVRVKGPCLIVSRGGGGVLYTKTNVGNTPSKVLQTRRTLSKILNCFCTFFEVIRRAFDDILQYFTFLFLCRAPPFRHSYAPSALSPKCYGLPSPVRRAQRYC